MLIEFEEEGLDVAPPLFKSLFAVLPEIRVLSPMTKLNLSRAIDTKNSKSIRKEVPQNIISCKLSTVSFLKVGP